MTETREGAPSQASKKNANAAKTGRRRVGKLSALMTMPVDVFYEVGPLKFDLQLPLSNITTKIAARLHPSDLIHLARASRVIRAHLMTKNASQVWKSARDNLRLPPCPSDLSEPQYADLLFEKGCYVSRYMRFDFCVDILLFFF